MKRLLLGMMAIMMLVMSGCGGSTETVVVPEPPSISLNQFTKDTAAEFIDGSIDFFAPDSDADTITVAVFDSSGAVVFRKETLLNLQDVFDVIRGTVPFSIDYVTYPAGTFTFSIFVTDVNGNTSNLVVNAFSVP
jgi:hypothetical protein